MDGTPAWHEQMFVHSQVLELVLQQCIQHHHKQQDCKSPARYSSFENNARHVALRSTPALVMPFTSSMTLPYLS